MKRVLVMCLALAACSSESQTPAETKDAGTANNTDSGSASGEIQSGPCSEAKSLCTTFKMPASMSGAPTRLVIGLYKSLPPMGPPDALLGQYTSPKVTAGQEMNVKMNGVEVDGEYFLYAALHMPGGGSFQPKKGVDFVAFTPAAFSVTSSKATTVPSTLEFKLAE